MAARINGAIARLANDQPVFYTGGHTGAELTVEAGMAMADTWADYINIGMEHGPLDIPGLSRFMQGMASVRTPTPVVIVELPFEGREPEMVRANAWQVRQLLAVGVHGFLLCHAEQPEAVAAVVKAMRYTFRGGTRGSGGQAAAGAVWGVTPQQYLELADPWPLNPNGELLLGLKIENRRALENAFDDRESARRSVRGVGSRRHVDVARIPGSAQRLRATRTGSCPAARVGCLQGCRHRLPGRLHRGDPGSQVC